MIAFLDTNNLDECERELDLPCEQLLTPLTRYKRVRSDSMFAIDNGAFTRLTKRLFYLCYNANTNTAECASSSASRM